MLLLFNVLLYCISGAEKVDYLWEDVVQVHHEMMIFALPRWFQVRIGMPPPDPETVAVSDVYLQ